MRPRLERAEDISVRLRRMYFGPWMACRQCGCLLGFFLNSAFVTAEATHTLCTGVPTTKAAQICDECHDWASGLAESRIAS